MFSTIFFGLVALFWVLTAAQFLRGMPRLPKLADAAPLPDAECPRVSVIFSARNEAERIAGAVQTMLALDYHNYEVVAVNDRSTDATPRILEDLAGRHPHLKVVHVTELPAGWLGKTHGLQRGYEAATGDWLLFTDADIRFSPDVLRRAMRVARERGWDHLVLLGGMELESFGEKALMTFFMLSFTMFIQPWSVPNPKSRYFAGVGYFQLLRRAAYVQSGTHQKLAMEVVDDMKLGKIIKRAGFRSGVGIGHNHLQVRWHSGVRNIVRGVEKNFFAGAYFSLPLVALQIAAVLACNFLPFVAVFVVDGWARVLAAMAALVAAVLHGATARNARCSPLLGLTHPFGALLFTYMLARSTVITLRKGGIVWRDTFYSLRDLRKGSV